MKVVKKKRLKIIPVILLIVIIFFLYLFISFIFHLKIKNIYITNNQFLKDDYIIEKAGIKDYPPIVKNLSYQVKERLIKDVFINDVSVNYSFFGVLNISIEENKLLFYNDYNKKYVLSSKDEVDILPYKKTTSMLINFVPDITYSRLCEKYSYIRDEISSKISQIKYDPSEYDKERFLLYMIDGNYVYITLSKIQNINYYNDIYKTLNNKKGILYLDSGNHFQEIK